MILFADSSDSTTAILMVISGLIGGGANWVVSYFTTRHDQQRREKKEDEKTIVDHMKEVEDRCNEENKELKAEIKATNRQNIKIINYIMYLQGILVGNGIQFKLMDLGGDVNIDTDTHNLPTTQETNSKRKQDAPTKTLVDERAHNE